MYVCHVQGVFVTACGHCGFCHACDAGLAPDDLRFGGFGCRRAVIFRIPIVSIGLVGRGVQRAGRRRTGQQQTIGRTVIEEVVKFDGHDLIGEIVGRSGIVFLEVHAQFDREPQHGTGRKRLDRCGVKSEGVHIGLDSDFELVAVDHRKEHQ